MKTTINPPDLTPTDQIVRRAVYDGFLTAGAARSIARLSRELGLDVSTVAASLNRLAAARHLVLHPESGEILMANPFSAIATGFRVESEGQGWWGNCIWDALGILAMLGRDGAVTTSCPDCGRSMQLTVTDGRLDPTEGIVHFAVPAALWWDDVVFT